MILMNRNAAKLRAAVIVLELLVENFVVGTVNVIYKEIPMKVLYIIMELMKLLKTLLHMVFSSKTEKTLEKTSDLEVIPTFKVTYPKGWHERQNSSMKEKTEHFNNWASKL
jgi:hypothetical protein